LALLFPLRILRILVTTGSDVPSSDDGFIVVPFMDKVLSGGYNWGHVFRDTFNNTHSCITAGLTYLVMAHVRHFNTYDALYFGLALVAVALVLMHKCADDAFQAEHLLVAALAHAKRAPILGVEDQHL
jgi:hypothetical protein